MKKVADMTVGEFWVFDYKRTHGWDYPTKERKEWVNLQRASNRYGLKRIKWCIYQFHRNCNDKWVAEDQRWSIFAFTSRLTKLLTDHQERLAKASKAELERIAEMEQVAPTVNRLAENLSLFGDR